MGTDATHFLLGQHWKSHFTRKSQTGSGMSVGQLRKWINDPKPMGLPKEAENLIILLFAAQTNRTLYLHGGPFEGTLTNIPEASELRIMDLPNPEVWKMAVHRAAAIFSFNGSSLLNANNVNQLTTDVKKKSAETRRPCQVYVERLKARMTQLGMPLEKSHRLKTATRARSLLERLLAAEEDDALDVLANADIATSEAAMGECVAKSAELEGNLETAGWDIFEAIGQLTDERKPQVGEILKEVRLALESDEHAVSLAPALREAQAKAVRLLTKKALPGPTPEIQPPPVTPPPPKRQKRVVGQGEEQGVTLDSASERLSALKSKLQRGQTVRINLSWIIEEGGE
jgi:hypothetical protein